MCIYITLWYNNYYIDYIDKLNLQKHLPKYLFHSADVISCKNLSLDLGKFQQVALMVISSDWKKFLVNKSIL